MDFTQIMQRYTRLRESFEQGEIDADSFEQQVNGMIYKDEEGRYWQIGVQTGLWYYYDGTKWVQDDLVEEIPEEEEPEEPEIEMAAIDEIFPMDEAATGQEPSPFDMAFEEQLESQFANGGNSQIFDVFDDTDIFASILKGKGMNMADDPLAAPAEEVEGLAEHLETTQPVSIESLMGEGTAITTEDHDGDIDFLFEDSEDSEYPEVQEGSQIDLNAVLGADASPVEASMEEETVVEDPVVPETDVRPVNNKDVVTGELHMPVEPLTRDALDVLQTESGKLRESALEEFESSGAPFEIPVEDETVVVDSVDEEHDPLDWKLEPNEYPSTSLEDSDLPESPMLEILDDDFSLDALVADSEQAYLDETQAVPVNAASEFYDEPTAEEDDDFFGPGDSAPFELPVQPESQQINTVPGGVSVPAGETMQSARPIKPRRKLPTWVTALIIFVALFCVVLLVLLGTTLFSSMDDTNLPAVADILPQMGGGGKIDEDDPRYITYDSFDGISKDDWVGLDNQAIGFADYYQGFYYIYSMAPEVPTVATANLIETDIVIDVETTQLNEKHPETLSTYGVMCRVQENGDGYAFRITNNGQYVIEKYVNGVFAPVAPWGYSEAIKANKDLNKNHIVATCDGNQLSLSVNGHLLTNATDATFTEGRVGFIAQAGASIAYTEVHYDELWLSRPK